MRCSDADSCPIGSVIIRASQKLAARASSVAPAAMINRRCTAVRVAARDDSSIDVSA